MPESVQNQIVTAGHLFTILDMRPSATSNEATLLMTTSTSTLVPGPYSIPNYQNKNQNKAPDNLGIWPRRQQVSGLIAYSFCLIGSSYPNQMTRMTETRAYWTSTITCTSTS